VSIEGNQATEALPAEFAAARAFAILIAALFWKERGLALGFYAPLLSTLEFLNGHIRRRESCAPFAVPSVSILSDRQEAGKG